MLSRIPTRHSRTPTAWQGAALLGAAGLAAALLYVQAQKKAAERAHPPQGKFIDVDGVRLHYLERGEGQALVMLHGNGLFAGDFQASGLFDQAAARYRVLAFDRPGFGYSARPGSNSDWTPEQQARLLYRALHQLGVERPIILGHSWGALVALAMGLDYPRYTRALALVSGAYYPDAAPSAPTLTAVPGIGHLLRYTVVPLVGRMLWPRAMRKVFGPAPVPPRFDGVPVWMALRPDQLGATASETAMLAGATARLSRRYAELTMPVAVIAGSADQIADPGHNALRLHGDVQHSDLVLAPGVGHMPHYAQPEQIVAALERLDSGVLAQRPHVTAHSSPTMH